MSIGANTIDTPVILPASSGDHLLSGRIKSTPADFVVQEVLGFDFDGHGEHLYICVRKCALNTNDVIQSLQQQFQCRPVDIGVSGLKDKNAITDQWFSIRTPKNLGDTNLHCAPQKELLNESYSAGLATPAGQFCVLKSDRHSRKLRRGSHRYNRFIITIREVVNQHPCVPLKAALGTRMRFLQDNGFANYFGPQRFGFDYQNVFGAERLFANPKRRLSRNKRSLLISAARSHLFNSVCAERVRAKNWNTPLDGEPMLLDGSQSFFINDSVPDQKMGQNNFIRNGSCTSDDNDNGRLGDTIERCQRHDVHPTGPMWGKGETLATGECQQLESSILRSYTALREGLENTGLNQQRRALRANVNHLTWHWQGSSIVKLDFKLLKGVYATSMLSEFVIY